MKQISRIYILLCLISYATCKIELSCSVFLFGENDWLLKNGTNNCIQEVVRVRDFCGGTKINFVPTLFFVDKNQDSVPEYFATKEGLTYYATNQTNMINFVRGMRACFKRTLQEGFQLIEITPHLDDGTGGGQWRNTIIMNPLAKYDGTYSYYDIMIKPLVYSLKRAMEDTIVKPVNFALQGEMNQMLISYPLKWLKLVKIVRCMLPTNSKVGVSVNFNKLCGFSYCSNQHRYSTQSIQKLFTSIDFLGMSSYPSMSNTNELKNLNSFANGLRTLAGEFKVFNIDLTTFKQRNIALHFSEFGIGGSSCTGNGFPARDGNQALPCPWFGIFGVYNPQTNPWETNEMKTFQDYYYQQLIRWISNGSDPILPIEAVYVWNVASWDVAGIYKDSTTINGTYQNPAVIKKIKAYNDDNIIP
jgi:hypothetical protein